MKPAKNPVLVWITLVAFVLASSGCGTLLHPERLKAKRSDKIDAKIVVLDCLWLLVWIVPGVIALGVDFYNNTIFYSEEELATLDNVGVDIHGRAPADCLVTLRLLDSQGRDLMAPAEVRAKRGQELPGSLVLAIPARARLAGAELVLAVDGRDQVTWSLKERVD